MSAPANILKTQKKKSSARARPQAVSVLSGTKVVSRAPCCWRGFSVRVFLGTKTVPRAFDRLKHVVVKYSLGQGGIRRNPLLTLDCPHLTLDLYPLELAVCIKETEGKTRGGGFFLRREEGVGQNGDLEKKKFE